MNIFSALAKGTLILREHGIDTPRLDSEVLLSHIMGCSRIHFITCGSEEISDETYDKFMEYISKRAAGYPAAYLIGRKEFMGLDFIVKPGVLIPRGDTEIVVEKAIEECKKIEGAVKVCDVCCGSGAIGVSIAKYVSCAYVDLIDISETAVSVSSENAVLNGVDTRVMVHRGDLLHPVFGQSFDVIVSNPPYIETEVIGKLQRDVKDYEPHLALDGGADGLKFYREITSQAVKCLKTGGIIIYEIGYNQAEAVVSILEQHNFKDMEVLKDLAGNDRCVTGKIGSK